MGETLLSVGLAITGTTMTTRSPWFGLLDELPISDADLLMVLWDALAIEAARRGDRRAMTALMDIDSLGSTPTGHELRELLQRLAHGDRLIEPEPSRLALSASA